LNGKTYFDRKAQPHGLPPEITPFERLGVYGVAVRGHQVLVVTPNWSSDKFDFPGGKVREYYFVSPKQLV
jgi:hypothetical protein